MLWWVWSFYESRNNASEWVGTIKCERDIPRNDPFLVKVVETLGEEANGAFSKLKIVNIPAHVDWEINEYDGMEWVAEKHRKWG